MFLLLEGGLLVLGLAVPLTLASDLYSPKSNLIRATGYNDTFQARCLAFNPLDLVANATVNAHEFVTAGTTLLFPDNDATCARPSQTVSVDVCRIALNISTSSTSGLLAESWFPSNWTGRFLTLGNGGIDGCIKYEDINYGAMNGFVAIGSNNGHNGTGGLAFYHNDGVVEDYAWRSIHTITEVGKKLTNSFYDATFNHSYYLGCSGGGRQGIKAAEMFPNDFDGIVVGAPAVNFNNMTSWRASFFNKTGAANSTNFISAATWSGLIHNEILKQCDTIDGVADGVIEDPELCHFDPTPLGCEAQSNATSCLTPAQVQIVREVFSPLYGASGELVFPAMQPGSEQAATQKMYNGTPFSYSLDWFRYVVYQDPTWDDTHFSTADITAAQALNPFNVQTWPSDLSSYTGASHGGKLLVYHGQQDQQITSFNTPRFYARLLQGMNLTHTEMDSVLRFFRISGMTHCNSGPGPWMIGQATIGAVSSNDTVGVGFDPKSNVLAAMVDWVENAHPPDTIEGTKFVNDSQAAGVAFKRRHCRYPYRNTFMGGDSTLPDSWTCVLDG
ncbi:carboxylic ester hydrolase-17 [Coleophoma cylindrospora]|uniref:Carboxylic ester hydrolase n=1 Tax=Coleophoma cylindrospora TaxID=1849047 RepID=A0A3D8QKF0_9HELO|nr:carboxylic ester hydrolase-17 [Coleophoma cylindrospora]